MDFLVGDATGLLRRVDATTRCTYTYKVLPQDRNEAICCACWSGGQGLSATAASETELTLGRHSGRVEAMAPALPPRVRAGATATSSSPSSSADPHLLIRSSYSAAVPVVRCFQMPAACVQVGLLHEPQDRVLLNESARRDLVHHDPFFSAFNSVCPLSPSPLLPAPATSLAARQKAAAATDAPDAATPYAYATTDAAKADAADAAETRAAAVEAIEASSVVDDPRLLFCIDEEGHLLLLDWHGSFFEQLRSDGVSSNSNGGNSSRDSGGNARCTPIHIPSVPPYRVKEAKGTLTNSSGNGGDIFSSGSSSNVRCSNTDGGGNLGKHTSRNSCSSLWRNKTILPPAPQTAGMLRGDPWYCWSLRASKEEDEEATHVRAAWRVCGPVSCATPVNPLLPDRVAFGGRNNDVKVFDFSQGKYVWAAKNVKDTLLRLRVPVHISSLCWLPQVHPLVLAAGTAAGAVRLYDLRCQRRPVFEQEHACSSSSLGGAAARERRVLCALCAETCDEEAAALLANIRKSRSTHSCSSNTGNGSATWTGIEDERYTSSTCCASNSSHSSKRLVGSRNITRGSSSSGCSNDNVEKKHSSITRNCSRGKANRAGTLETPQPALLPEDEEERSKIYEAVRGLYGKEKTRIFFSDNHGAVYVHRVLTGKALLRRIDPQQKKHNRTSCYAASSSSEAESEGDKADDESQEECSDEESDGEEPEGGCEEGEEGDEEEDEEEGEGHREAEQGMEKGEKAKKQDKRQRQDEAANNILLHRGDTRRINSGSIKMEEIQAGTDAPTTDDAKRGKAATSETSAEMERGGRGPRIAATAGRADAAAGVGPEYGKRYAMQLLRRHRLKRAQKLSTVKNSGRLSQSSAHGPQFMTLFEGCYKGAMGAIVALRMDRSTGLLVGAGYGRHTLVWNVRSRKLLFKVYLKQQLRIVMLRYSGGGTNDELKALTLLQSQNVPHEKQQQDAEHRREEISEAQHNTPQQQKPSGPDVKQKQVNQRQQPPQRVNKVLKGEKTVSRQKGHSRAYHSTEKSQQRKRRILRVEVQRRPTGQHQHQERQSRSNRQKKQSGVEEVRQGDHQGRATDTSAAGTGSAAVGSRQKRSITPDVKKKRKIG